MAATKALSVKDMNNQKIVNVADGSASTDVATKGQVDTGVTAAESRANHTGTQLAATISDFDTQVRTSRLDQMAAPTGAVSMGSQRITNQADPSGAQDSATKAYVDNAVSGLSTGLQFKGTVRAVSTVNVTVSSPGTTIDGLTAATGETFLLAGQTTGSECGPYVFNGSATPMTRATNWDTTAEAVLGSFWVVREGSKADFFAILSNDSTVTVGTTALTFVYVAPGGTVGPTGYTATSPVTSGGGSWTVTHSLGTKGVVVQVYRTASPYDDVDVYFERTDTNTVTIKPDIALASGEYTVVVQKVI